MARKMLFSNEMNHILRKHFEGNSEWEEKSVEVIYDVPGLPEPFCDKVTYFFNTSKNAIVFPAPLATAALTQIDADAGVEPPFQAAVDAVIKQEKLLPYSYSVSASLLGKGTVGRHYVAFHQAKNGVKQIFDSANGNPDVFLSSADSPSIIEIIWGILTVPYRALRLFFNKDVVIKSTFSNQAIDVFRLKTQPFYDGVSCGYHTSGAVMTMADIIDENKSVRFARLLDRSKRNKFDLRAEERLNDQLDVTTDNATAALHKAPSKVKSSDSLASLVSERNEDELEQSLSVSVPDDETHNTPENGFKY